MKAVYWSLEEKEPLASTKFEKSQGLFQTRVDSVRRRALFLIRENGIISVVALRSDGKSERLGALEFAGTQDEAGRWSTVATLERTSGRILGVSTETDVFVLDVGEHELGPARHIGRHERPVVAIRCDPQGRFVATADAEGEIHLWDVNGSSSPIVLKAPPGIQYIGFTPNGTLMSSRSLNEEGLNRASVWDASELPPRLLRSFDLGKLADYLLNERIRRMVRWGVGELDIRIWSMGGPFDAEPLILNRGEVQRVTSAWFNPLGDWLVTADATGLSLWPFSKKYPVALQRHESLVIDLAFAPDGSWLASASVDDTIRLWPLEGEPPPPGRILGQGKFEVAVSPEGNQLLVGSNSGASFVFADGSPPITLEGLAGQVWGVAFSPDGRLAAGAGGQFDPAERVIQIWDVESGEAVKVLEVGEEPVVFDLQFMPEGRLLSTSASGLLSWNVETGERELIYEGMPSQFAASADGRRVVLTEKNDPAAWSGKVIHLEVDSGKVTPLDRFGSEVTAVALDPTGTFIVTGDRNGDVRVGLVDGGGPHLLIGHESTVWAVAIDPKGRWIASGCVDGIIRLWPMPDLTKPPLHTLPREELIAKLKTLTNIRVVRDPESSTGWTLTHDPFPGWETVPTW